MFHKEFSTPQHKGQVVLTFMRFSPNRKYLLFDMDQTFYIVSVPDNPAVARSTNLSCKEVSFLGSKMGYDSVSSFDFSSLNDNQPLVAIRCYNNLATGNKLQSIGLWYNCYSLSFFSYGRDERGGASYTGSLSSHLGVESSNRFSRSDRDFCFI